VWLREKNIQLEAWKEADSEIGLREQTRHQQTHKTICALSAMQAV